MPQTTEQVLRQQAQAAARARAAASNRDTRPMTQLPLGSKPNSHAVATRPTTSVPAVDTRTPQQKYLDEIAPSSFVGPLIKFSKDGKFVLAESGEEISPDKDFVALCDEVLAGWIKFNAPGEPPDRVMGLHFDGFVMPERETLGDLDPSTWPAGLSGEPADVWQHQILLPLQDRENLTLCTFGTTSVSGRRAVGNLLRHYERLRKSHADHVPVVRLRPGGFNHRDPRVGWVAVPVFPVVGRTPRDSAAQPDTSPSADMNDSLPF